MRLIITSYYDWVKLLVNSHIKALLLIIILALVVAIGSMLIPLLVTTIFSHFHEASASYFFVIGCSFFLCQLALAFICYLNEFSIKSLTSKIVIKVFPNAVNLIINLPLNVIRTMSPDELSQIITHYESSLEALVGISLSLFIDAIALMVVLLFMLYLHARLAMLALIMGFFLLVVHLFSLHKRNHYQSIYFTKYNAMSLFLTEMLFQIDKIRSANAEVLVFNKWFSYLCDIKWHEKKSITHEMVSLLFASLLPISLLAGFYIFSVSSVTMCTLLPVIICAAQFTSIMYKLAVHLTSLTYHLPALKRMQMIHQDTRDATRHIIPHTKLDGDIKFDDVSLRDHDSGKMLLSQISIHIHRGQFVAIIGPSGAGKSTLLRLILGLDTPDSGAVLIDNRNVRNLNMNELRKEYGVVLQTATLLPGTIFSNIASHTVITLSEAWQLANQVGLADDINKMPMKMHTILSDNASESISGGQIQKILIARALATQPSVLILDEATSALDNASQALIYRHINTLNMTRVVIAHRYNTITTADVIYVLDQSRVVDSGSYDELVQRAVIPLSPEKHWGEGN